MLNIELSDDPLVSAAELADAVREVGQVPCQSDPDLWFPERSNENLPGYTNLVGHIDQPRNLCLNECPLVLHCRAHAIKHNEVHGIWGGTTLAERKLIWGRRAKQSRKGIPNRRH